MSYEANGKVFKAEVVYSGSQITLPNQSDTNTCYFNGWQVNGIGTRYQSNKQYTINNSTNFVADMANKALVTFKVNDQVYETQYVIPGKTITLPTLEDTETHYFNYWKINEEIVNLSSYKVLQDVIIVADMPQKAVVTYMVNGEVWKTQNIIPNTEVNLPTVPDTDTKFYTGWKVDGMGFSYLTYSVEEDVTFVVDFSDTGWVQTQDYNNISFIDGDCVWTDNENIYYSSYSDQYVLKENHTWEPMTWTGLTSFDGVDIWTDGEHTYYSHGSKQYILKENNTWEAVTWNDNNGLWGSYVWTDGENIYYDDSYVLNKETNTWEKKTWTGLTNPNGKYIWTDGEHTYYSYGSKQYVLNGDTWKVKTWTGLTNFSSDDIWTDGEHTYYSNDKNHYVLNGDTWEAVTWTGLPDFHGRYIWTDGEHFYYSCTIGDEEAYKKLNLVTKAWEQVFPKGLTFINRYSDLYRVEDVCYYSNENTYLVTNKTNRTWEEKTWTGLNSFYGSHVWTDGEHTYYSYKNDHYLLNGDTWEAVTWTGLPDFDGRYIWTDGEHTYYSYGSKQYVLNGDTWKVKTWTGLTNFSSDDIWTDGEHTYYSNDKNHYVLNGDTWEEKTWTGLTRFYGSNIWTDGENILCNLGNHSHDCYLLNADTHEWKRISGGRVQQKNLWTDGNNIYYHYSSDIYLFDKDTCKWVETTWRGLKGDKKFFWTDGINYYCFTNFGVYKLTKFN